MCSPAVAPRAVTFSPFNRSHVSRRVVAVSVGQTKKFGLPRERRLIRTEDFGVILRTRNDSSFRVHSAFFSAGCLENAVKGRIRIGVTVGKHNAPLSVNRAIVKRTLREAARLRMPELLNLLGSSRGIDVSLRLKTALRTLEANSRAELKRRLHEDATALMDDLLRRVKRRQAAQTSKKEPA